MKTPEDARDWARQRLANQRRYWFDGGGEWPLSVSLDRPTRAVVLRDIAAVKTWSATWRAWLDRRRPTDPSVEVDEVAWPGMGPQTFASRLTFADASAVARFVGESVAWDLASARRARLLTSWPLLARSGLGTFYMDLTRETPADFERLMALLSWFVAHPDSGLYVRQLPVEGVDTKWVDRTRRSLVSQLLLRVKGGIAPPDAPEAVAADAQQAEPVNPSATSGGEKSADSLPAYDFYRICGLRRPPIRARIAVLCPDLRQQIGGVRDLESSIEDLARLPIRPRGIVVVENLETAYSLEDAPGVIAAVKLGNAVGLVSQFPWARGLPVLYWGDVDTYGFSILAQARQALEPHGSGVESVLMDALTVEKYLKLIVKEPVQASNVDRRWLRPTELEVYEGLLGKRWGISVRIEQERLPWPEASALLREWILRLAGK